MPTRTKIYDRGSDFNVCTQVNFCTVLPEPSNTRSSSSDGVGRKTEDEDDFKKVSSWCREEKVRVKYVKIEDDCIQERRKEEEMQMGWRMEKIKTLRSGNT